VGDFISYGFDRESKRPVLALAVVLAMVEAGDLLTVVVLGRRATEMSFVLLGLLLKEPLLLPLFWTKMRLFDVLLDAVAA